MLKIRLCKLLLGLIIRSSSIARVVCLYAVVDVWGNLVLEFFVMVCCLFVL